MSAPRPTSRPNSRASGTGSKPFDIVLVNTAAGARYGHADYVARGCGMGREATLYLTDRGVRVTGIDGWSWDAPFVHTARRIEETGDYSLFWEGHKAGATSAYCHIEKLSNLEALPATGFTVSCFPVKVERASAGWSPGGGDLRGLTERKTPMKLATLPNGTRDGRLHVVSRDLTRAAPARAAATLQAALEDWAVLGPDLVAQYDALNAAGGDPFDPATALAPLPRAWQWLDGSAFESHGDLMDKVFGMTKKERHPKPLMYQGVSNAFFPPVSEVPLLRQTTASTSRANSESSPTPCRSTLTSATPPRTSASLC